MERLRNAGGGIVLIGVVLVAGSGKIHGQQPETRCPIEPGDANGSINCQGPDDDPDITDVYYLLDYLYQAGPTPTYLRQKDMNGDLVADVSDAIGLFLFLFGPNPPEKVVDVPLRLLEGAQDLGRGRGISFGDFNRDGYPDLFVYATETLFENNFDSRHDQDPNNDNEPLWKEHPDVIDGDPMTDPPPQRYGASFGDFDNDGWPDIATEPRDPIAPPDTAFNLLRNNNGDYARGVSTEPLHGDGGRERILHSRPRDPSTAPDRRLAHGRSNPGMG